MYLSSCMTEAGAAGIISSEGAAAEALFFKNYKGDNYYEHFCITLYEECSVCGNSLSGSKIKCTKQVNAVSSIIVKPDD